MKHILEFQDFNSNKELNLLDETDSFVEITESEFLELFSQSLFEKAPTTNTVKGGIFDMNDAETYKWVKNAKSMIIDNVKYTFISIGDGIKQAAEKAEKGKKATSSNPYLGWRATYEEVTSYGSKAFSNFYYTPKEAKSIFSSTIKQPIVKKVVEETKKQPEKKEINLSGSKTLNNLYSFFEDNMEGLLDLLNINSFDDLSSNINKNLNNIFDKIVSNGYMDTMKTLAKIEKKATSGDTFTTEGSEEFLKFAEAYEKSTLDDLIKKCKAI
jgi:hypothetical protein